MDLQVIILIFWYTTPVYISLVSVLELVFIIFVCYLENQLKMVILSRSEVDVTDCLPVRSLEWSASQYVWRKL